MPKTHFAEDNKVGQDGVVTGAQDTSALDKPDIQIIDGGRLNEKAEALAFDAEPVTVVIQTSNSKNDNQVVEVWNDGRVQRFIRGQEQTVKRKFVEVLARAKQTNYRNEEFVDSTGANTTRWPTSTGLKYPFAVIEDKNPKGREWLRNILAEA